MNRGTIAHQGCLATCGQCGRAEVMKSDSIMPAMSEARRKGWSRSYRWGWRCGECATREPRSRTPEGRWGR